MAPVADSSIVMIAHNGCEFTQIALDSILKASVLPKEMIFVNNGSSDSTAELIAEMGPLFSEAGITFILLENDENFGCSLARNLAWEKATAKYVVFMDNDAAVCTSDYLTRLVDAMEAAPKLGVLGPKMIYPYLPHPIQCAGCAVNPIGRVRFRGRGANRHDDEYNQPLTVPVLISATWIMRRDFLEMLSGLDEYFHPVQYEDLDFCMRVNEAGYHCAYTPDVEMYHFEGVTTASFGRTTYQKNIAEQSLKFKKRWIHVIRNYPPDDAAYRWLADEELGLDPELKLDLTMED